MMDRNQVRRRLPPLNALRAFEAAARHLNFSRAADELSVTPGAVSQQIQNLEDYVGAPLFKRTPKGLVLTDAAQTALPALREAFDRLAEAASLLTAAVDGRRLTITAPPSFAAKWLAPKPAVTVPVAPKTPVAAAPAVAAPVAPATTDDAKKMKAKDCIAQADKQGLHGKPRKAFKHKCKMAA